MLPTPKTPALTPYATSPTLGAATVADACKYLNGWDGSAVGYAPLANCSVSGNTVTLSAPPGITLPPVTISGSVTLLLTAPAGAASTKRGAEYDLSSISLQGQSSLAVKTDAPTHSVAVYLTGKTSSNSDIATVIDFQGGASASEATFGAGGG